MDVTNIVALNTKALREGKKLTLDAAAVLTGVSRSMLAQIEKGDVNPTISVLWKIANGYKVPFASLVERPQEAVAVVKGEKATLLQDDEGRYLNYLIFPFEEQKPFDSCRIVIRQGGFLSARPHLKGAEEYITVFAGAVEITVDGTAYSLEKGDSIRFRADVPHAYQNTGGETAELSMLIYYTA